MNLRTMASDEARTHWRDLLDAVSAGKTNVVIERFGKPTAILVGVTEYETYQQALALLQELVDQEDPAAAEELLATLAAKQRVQEFLADPHAGESYAAFRRRMVAEGVLDE